MDGYTHNLKPFHFDDSGYTDQSQDEVYSFAHKLLLKNGWSSIVDIGCGSGFKLIKYFDRFETVGVETEPCISHLRKRYPNKIWVDSGEAERSFSTFQKNTDLVICSDVIEHIIDPDRLIAYIKSFTFKQLVISTPDRKMLKDHINEAAWYGPPINMCHVREWSFEEFNSYLNGHFKNVSGYHCKTQFECMFFTCSQ